MANKDIEKFSTWARYELQNQVELRAALYGVTQELDIANLDSNAWEVRGRTLSTLERTQRISLIEQIKERGYSVVIEEATYTWFNRFVALRFMDVNGYLETGASWFTTPGQEGFKPEVLPHAHYLNIAGLDEAEVDRFRTTDDEEGLYRYLLVKQCNELSRVLPRMFATIEDWTVLLCPSNLLRDSGILAHMAHDIPEEDWRREVEIVGWMYQYYNSCRKEQSYSKLKKGGKFEVEDIAPVTQLFTPDWIVRYLVQNSLGRLWMYNRPQSALAAQMEYYTPPAQMPADYPRLSSPEELRICDPACGSGHILTYAFDLLYAIYEEEGYAAADIPSHILEKNLYGIELDRRAGELAYFALMMKALTHDRRILTRGVQPQVCVLEPVAFTMDELSGYMDALGRDLFTEPFVQTLHQFEEADNFGSLISPVLTEQSDIRARLELADMPGCLMLRPTHEKVQRVLEHADALSPKYHVVVTNPPYLTSSKMNARLLEWARQHYAESKTDLCTMFMERGRAMLLPHGFCAMVTMDGWMYGEKLEKLRRNVLATNTIICLAHLGTHAFEQISGEVVSVCAFVLSSSFITSYKGDYIRLVEHRTSALKAEACAAAVAAPNKLGFYRVDAEAMAFIEGSPISTYCLPLPLRRLFETNPSLQEVAEPRQGMATSDNKRFLRHWHEVSFPSIGFGFTSTREASVSGVRWFPYNKGGGTRKWYGNYCYVVDYARDGAEIKANVLRKYSYLTTPDFVVKNQAFYFRASVSWSDISSTVSPSRNFRYYPAGLIFDAKGQSAFGGDYLWKMSLLSCLNTHCFQVISRIIDPRTSFQIGAFGKLPYAKKAWSRESAARAERLITIAKEDWDSYETSWDFSTLPLLRAKHRRATLTETYAALRAHRQALTDEMARLEEENNRTFNELYELGDEFPAAMPIEQITLTCNPAYRYGVDKPLAEKEMLMRTDTMKELLSYAVGCMFGRYSLSTPGLAYAGGEWDAARYGDDALDGDNIIPISDDEYFPDDICGRFVDFVRRVFGAETLEENLAFIADALGGGKGSARDIIRAYFLKGFYADHCQAYGNRPIYWQFDSGRKAGFRALVYLHRYDQDTLARMRTDYVFRQQDRYHSAIVDMRQRLDNAVGRERTYMNKQLSKLLAQEEEIAEFEQKLHHLADQRIKIDLDDGVVANYSLFKQVVTKIK